MDRVIFCLVVLWIFGTSFPVSAQDRYAVHYKFKPQSSHSLDAPEAFLLPPALDRRARENITVDSTDLPVAAKYVEVISSLVEEISYHSKWLNASLVVASSDQLRELGQLPFVASVTLVAKGSGEAGRTGKLVYNESFFPESDKAASYEFQNGILGIPAMHKAGFTGAGVVIAVFDAGFQNTDKISGMQHLFDNDQILATKNFVTPDTDEVFGSDPHGTAALSLMASHKPGALVGGAYGAKYILCITEDVASEYRIEEYNWIRAAEFSDSLGVDIINSSLGYNYFDDPMMNYSPEDLDGKTAVISRGAALAAQKGILVVSSAGNEGNGSWQTLTPPADADGILSVGSVNNSLTRSGFSSIGPTKDGRIKPELVAFGSGVTVWRQADKTNTSSGTSFTSPQIAALAAGLWEARPDWTRETLIENLLASGTRADSPDSELGYGIPNFLDAYYGKLLETEPEKEWVQAFIYPNPLDGDLLNIDFGREKNCSFKMISTQGHIIRERLLSRNSQDVPYEASLANTVPGLYIIELSGNGGLERLRLIRK